jgi:hypothetical protein
VFQPGHWIEYQPSAQPRRGQIDRHTIAAASGGEPALEVHVLVDLQAVGDQCGTGIAARAGKLNYCVEKVLGGEIPVRHCSGCGFDAATVMRLIRH